MITYNDLYELLRKEKYSETLQPLPKQFLADFSEYLNDKSNLPQIEKESLFLDSLTKTKKQFENAVSIFRELITKRKRKILNLVFVATETGIMKRDHENMLTHEKEIFEKLVKLFEESDKNMAKIMNNVAQKKAENKLIIFKQEIEQFIDHSGNTLGPFKSGELVNIETSIADILVSENKASLIDEE
ncbi:MAG: hypothetical protein AABX73_01850 [Nanoarchaeota archaeon]